MQKKNTKKIKSGNNDADDLFDLNNYGVTIQTLSETEYASSYGQIDAAATQLCFSTNGVAASTDNIGPVIPYPAFFFHTSNEVLKCVGYRTSWVLPSYVGLYVNHAGYLFYFLEKEWEWDSSDRRWVNKCGMTTRRDKIGKGAYAVVQTSRHINSFNDGTSLLGSISNWILSTLKLDPEQQRSKFPKLVFNEPIFYIVPQPSLLELTETAITTSHRKDSVVKILDFIGIVIKNSSNIPLSEFKFYFWSSNPEVAAVSNPVYGPTDKITFKKTGTFILNGTQQFYQNHVRNVAFKKMDFAITVKLTISIF
jgi:hypothetical protein